MYFTGAIRKNKVFMVFHSCWHNFPVGTTSHWNNFPLEQLPKSQLPTGTTSLFIQLPYGTTYPWYNFPMAQLTPGTTSLWHNLPLAQLILEQLPYGTSSYGTTSRGNTIDAWTSCAAQGTYRYACKSRYGVKVLNCH